MYIYIMYIMHIYYADDIFVLFPNVNDHNDILISLNMISDSIKFRVEVECVNKSFHF